MEGIRGEDGGLQGLDGGRELVVDESCWRLVRRGGGGPTSGGGGSIGGGGPSRSQPMEAPAAAIRQCNRHHFSARKELRRDLPIGGRAVRWCVGELYAYWPGCWRLQIFSERKAGWERKESSGCGP